MNTNWATAATEQEFVNYFNEEERSVIIDACEGFVQWDNLHKFDSDTHIIIGRAASIKHLFTEPTFNKVHPYEFISALMSVINDYKLICADDLSVEGPNGDCDYVIHLRNSVACCREMLTQLSNL